MKKFLYIILLLSISINLSAQGNILKARKVLVGADLLLSEYFHLIKNKKLGIITNQTALLSSRIHWVDSLFNRNDVKITALFAPKYGLKGNILAEATSQNKSLYKNIIPIYSLYGQTNKITKEMLKDVEILIYDIQDIGSRFSPFLKTLFYTLQAAAENKIPILILDRPNPIGGLIIDGPIQKEELASDSAITSIPIIHGMTIGEVATMFNESVMKNNNLKADLTVIKMKSWERGLYYDKCNIKWIKPVPDIYYIVTIILYPAVYLLEGTNISIGRGTEYPFQLIGAPFLNSDSLFFEMKNLNLPGVEFFKTDFTPKDIPYVVKNPIYKDQICHGIKISVTNRYKFDVMNFGINLLYVLHKLYPKDFKFNDQSFDKISGDKKIRELILSNKTPKKIISVWQEEQEEFKKLRNKYLLY